MQANMQVRVRGRHFRQVLEGGDRGAKPDMSAPAPPGMLHMCGQGNQRLALPADSAALRPQLI